LKSYPQILEVLDTHGFHDAVIFKGFSTKEKHNLNILISDRFTADTEPKPQTTRKLAVKDELTALLKCKIVLTTEDQMKSHYLKKLDSTNSVKLTKEVPSQDIEAIFGQDWTFNQPDTSYFWSASPATKDEEKIVEELAPSKLLLEELEKHVTKVQQYQGKNLDEIFTELKQAVQPLVSEPLAAAPQVQNIAYVK